MGIVVPQKTIVGRGVKRGAVEELQLQLLLVILLVLLACAALNTDIVGQERHIVVHLVLPQVQLALPQVQLALVLAVDLRMTRTISTTLVIV